MNGDVSGRELLRDARELWEEIFSEDSASFLNYYFGVRAADNRIQTKYEGGKLAAMIHWNPFTIRLMSREFHSRYLAGISTRPEYRHRGYMAELLGEGLAWMNSENVPFVFLLPVNPDIYTPFGFRYFYEKEEIRLDVQEWMSAHAADRTEAEPGSSGEPGEETLFVRRLSSEGYDFTGFWVTEEMSRRLDSFCLRDTVYLERAAKECGSEGGGVEGIFRVSGGNARAGSGDVQDSDGNVREGAGDAQDSDGNVRGGAGRVRGKEALLGVFSWWEDDVTVIRDLVTVPELETGTGLEMTKEALCRYFSGHKRLRIVTAGKGETRTPIMMGRITDLAEFVSCFHADQSVSLKLAVRDPLIPANDGVFLWEAGPEESGLIRVDEEPEITLDIDTLFLWLMTGAVPQTDDPGVRSKLEAFQTVRASFYPEIV